jgi:hypothetical protein
VQEGQFSPVLPFFPCPVIFFMPDGWFVFFEAALRMPGIRYDGAPEDLNKKRGGIKK